MIWSKPVWASRSRMPRRNASRSPEGSSGRSKSTNRGSLTAVAWRSNDKTFIGPWPDPSVLKRFDPGVRAAAQAIHQLKCRGRRPNDSSSGVFGIDGDLNHALIHQFRDRFINGGGRGDIGAKHEALHIQGGCGAAILNDNPIEESKRDVVELGKFRAVNRLFKETPYLKPGVGFHCFNGRIQAAESLSTDNKIAPPPKAKDHDSNWVKGLRGPASRGKGPACRLGR